MVPEPSPTQEHHTPGPWESAWSDGRGVLCVRAANGDWICGEIFNGPGKGMALAEAQANARLIAAAPDLFYALKMCVQRLERPELSPGADVVLEKAAGALAKAQGNPDA